MCRIHVICDDIISKSTAHIIQCAKLDNCLSRMRILLLASKCHEAELRDVFLRIHIHSIRILGFKKNDLVLGTEHG